VSGVPLFANLAPFILLLAAVLGLWVHRALWVGALVAAVIAAYLTGALHGPAALWIALAAALAWAYAKAGPGALRVALGIAFALYSVAMGLALLPGFDRVVLFRGLVLSPGAAPYDIAVGFPKVVTGIFILGLINPSLLSRRGLGPVLRRAAPVFAATTLAVMIAVCALGYTAFAPKWTPLFLWWAPINLLFTCLSEEAFFRGFLQHELARVGSSSSAARLGALVTAAVAFGLAHAGGGASYVIAAALAGVGYGWAFQRTQRIEAAMAVHFGVNAVHFLLFVYPTFAVA
jgi:membrane protease YdiL (CAAX protease family)